MSTTQATRTFVTDLFETISQEGLGQKYLDTLSDNLVWTATGSSPLSGRYEGKIAYQEEVLAKLRSKLDYSPKPQVNHILVDQNWAAVYFHTTGAKTSSGMDFGMEYCWLLKVEDNQVVEVVGFFDGKKMAEAFS